MTKTFFELIFHKIEERPYEQQTELLLSVEDYLTQQIENINKLIYSFWMEHQAKIHKGEWWTEKEVTKKEAKELFDIFLKLYQKAFGSRFEDYSKLRREYHFKKLERIHEMVIHKIQRKER